MYNHIFNRNLDDPITKAAAGVIEVNNHIRLATKMVNEAFDVVSRKALPHEMHEAYDAAIKELSQMTEDQLNELSVDKLTDYAKKAKKSAIHNVNKMGRENFKSEMYPRHGKPDMKGREKAGEKQANRKVGMYRAARSLEKKAGVDKSDHGKKLSTYIDRASNQLTRSAHASAHENEARKKGYTANDKDDRKTIKKRSSGIDKAFKKLSKKAQKNEDVSEEKSVVDRVNDHKYVQAKRAIVAGKARDKKRSDDITNELKKMTGEFKKKLGEDEKKTYFGYNPEDHTKEIKKGNRKRLKRNKRNIIQKLYGVKSVKEDVGPQNFPNHDDKAPTRKLPPKFKKKDMKKNNLEEEILLEAYEILETSETAFEEYLGQLNEEEYDLLVKILED